MTHLERFESILTEAGFVVAEDAESPVELGTQEYMKGGAGGAINLTFGAGDRGDPEAFCTFRFHLDTGVLLTVSSYDE